MARGLLLVGLLISALLVAWLTLRSSAKPTAASSSAAPSGQAGELPPDVVGKDPAAAKRYIESQNCSTSCQSAVNTCLSMADGDTGEARCQEQRAACEASCASSGQPTQ